MNHTNEKNITDLIIIGGGPAGLSAAVVAGRCRRSVLLFDTSRQRNSASHGMHNYLTRDDVLPQEFLQISRKEVQKYGVKELQVEITRARKEKNLFIVTDQNGRHYQSKKLLIATGLHDSIPEIPGIMDFYGRSVFHCPYCDGWEVKDKVIGVYTLTAKGTELCFSMKTWSDRVTLFTGGRKYINPALRQTLQNNGINIVEEHIDSITGENGQMRHIAVQSGKEIHCEALFFATGWKRHNEILKQLGCILTKKGAAKCNQKQQTNIPGLYVAGDAARDVQFVVVAAAEGAKAAVLINKELEKEIRK